MVMHGMEKEGDQGASGPTLRDIVVGLGLVLVGGCLAEE